MRVHACVRMRVRVCVRVCGRVCMRVRVCALRVRVRVHACACACMCMRVGVRVVFCMSFFCVLGKLFFFCCWHVFHCFYTFTRGLCKQARLRQTRLIAQPLANVGKNNVSAPLVSLTCFCFFWASLILSWIAWASLVSLCVLLGCFRVQMGVEDTPKDM